jgi:predicted nucleotidyltransferase
MYQEKSQFVDFVLNELTTRLGDLFFNNVNVVSVILIGSAARNELSVEITDDGTVDIFSDIEFLVVVESTPPVSFSQQIKKVCVLLEEELDIRSPLFGFDFGVLTTQRVKITPRTLWTFEVKKFGRTLLGEDVLNLFPDVELESIDIGNLNELIIVRLWNMFLHLPRNVIEEKGTEYEIKIAKIYYARNINDVLTILLPNIGMLVGGYRPRYAAFLDSVLGMEILKGLEGGIADALAIKLGEVENSTFKVQRSTFFKSFKALSNFIFGEQEINIAQELEWLNDPKVVSRALRESPWRYLRRKSIEITMMKRFYHFHPKAINKVFSDTIRPRLLKILFLLHDVLCLEQLDKEKEEKTVLAFQLYADLSLRKDVSYDNSQTANQNILALRSCMIEFMYCWFYPRAETTYEELKEIENWSQNL